MGNKFSLLQQLDEAQRTPVEKSPFAPGVEYQEYELEVDGKNQNIFIPLKECTAFEEALSQQTKYLTGDDLRKFLRNHRGIKVQ